MEAKNQLNHANLVEKDINLKIRNSVEVMLIFMEVRLVREINNIISDSFANK